MRASVYSSCRLPWSRIATARERETDSEARTRRLDPHEANREVFFGLAFCHRLAPCLPRLVLSDHPGLKVTLRKSRRSRDPHASSGCALASGLRGRHVAFPLLAPASRSVTHASLSRLDPSGPETRPRAPALASLLAAFTVLLRLPACFPCACAWPRGVERTTRGRRGASKGAPFAIRPYGRARKRLRPPALALHPPAGDCNRTAPS